MARRKKTARDTVQTETRKQILRQRKDRRERQMLLLVLGPILALVAAIIGYGAFRELVQKPHTPVARAEGEVVTAAQFVPRVAWERLQLRNSLSSVWPLLQQNEASVLEMFTSSYEQQRAGIGDATVDKLVDEIIIRKEAERRGIAVTEDDIDRRIRDDMATLIAPATPEPEVTATALITATAVLTEPIGSAEAVTATVETTVTPVAAATEPITGTQRIATTAAVSGTATTIPTQEIGRTFQTRIQPILDQIGFSLRQYREIVRQMVYRERLGEDMVSAEQRQLDVAYMSFSSEETARKAVDALEGGASWDEAVARFERPADTEEAAPEEAVESEGQTEQAATAEEQGAESTATEAPTETATPEPTETPTEMPTETPTEPPTSTATTLAEPITATLGAAEEVTGTGALTTSLELAEEEPSPTPSPTTVPDPYASTVGERAWMSKPEMAQTWSLDDEVAEEAISLTTGATGGPYESTGNMFYVVHVFDVAESRTIEDKDKLDNLRQGAVDDWLGKRKEEIEIDKYPIADLVPPEALWFTQIWERYLRPASTAEATSPIAISTASGVSDEPTMAPVVTIEPAFTIQPAGEESGGP